LKVRLTQVAQSDIDKAAEWYERQREGLGFTFLDRVDQGLDKIALNPTGYRKYSAKTDVVPLSNSRMRYGSRLRMM
jgi:hypothetical protein